MRGGQRPEVDEATFLEVLDETVERLEGAGIPFLIMGGISSASHGRERWTHDIDVFLRPEDAGQALATLAAAGFTTEETFWDWLFKAYRQDVMVDLIFRSAGGIGLDDEMLARARRIDFHGVKAPMLSPEDLLVIKVVVHDEQMPRHWHDALGLIGRAELDWDYLVRRARQYGARRVLALLVYAQSNDLIVPNRVIDELYRAIYRS
jgi:predicted nucleotidyltransferase